MLLIHPTQTRTSRSTRVVSRLNIVVEEGSTIDESADLEGSAILSTSDRGISQAGLMFNFPLKKQENIEKCSKIFVRKNYSIKIWEHTLSRQKSHRKDLCRQWRSGSRIRENSWYVHLLFIFRRSLWNLVIILLVCVALVFFILLEVAIWGCRRRRNAKELSAGDYDVNK